jgi:serine protease Do
MKCGNTKTRHVAGPMLLMMLLIGTVVFFLMTQNAQAVLTGLARRAPASFADLADEVKHSVVNISTTQVVKGPSIQPFFGPNAPFRDFFGDNFFERFFGHMPQARMKTHALGSGFVIDQDGFILTNNHVVERATEIKVKLESGKEYDAEVIGRDPKTDLALIRVKPDADLPRPARLGDSDAIR